MNLRLPTPLLFWPGMQRCPDELETLLQVLAKSGHASEKMSAMYDVGPPPCDKDSDIQSWLLDAERPVWDWWLGLSLGAATAHIAACVIPESRRPKRLTLINPFADRLSLSRFAGFDLSDQWVLRPIDFHFLGDIRVEIVISDRDRSIPPDQGIQLTQCYPANNVTVLHLDADHEISDHSQQQRLASLLTKH